jgi:predicted nucleic acid-binding protein
LDPADEIYTCFIVVGEWEYGVLNAPGQRRQAQIRAAGAPIFAALTAIWESTPAIALRYGAVHAQLRAAGQMIPTNDIWIAATALVYHATVVTTDPHFRRVTGLNVVDWTQP